MTFPTLSRRIFTAAVLCSAAFTAGAQRIDAGGHGLDALARQGQHQAGAIPGQSRVTVGMTQPVGQVGHVETKLFGYVHRTPITGKRWAYHALLFMTQ